MANKKSRVKMLCILVLIAVVVVMALLYVFKYIEGKNKDSTVTADSSSTDDSDDYTYMVEDGVRYKYNTSLINILFLGVDSSTDIDATDAKESNTGENGRVDSIYLLSMDRKNKETRVIAFSRDTMTDIRMTNAFGKDIGWGNSHLAFAFSYGDGKDKSCRYTVDAVSKLVNNIPILYYCAANINSLSSIIDIVGSVDVVVPNDDLSDYGFVKGSTVSINSGNIERFVRYRDTGKTFSNTGRMERQKVFLNAYMSKFRQLSLNNGTLTKVTKLLSSLITNITVGELSDFIDLYSECSFDIDNDYYIPSGNNVEGTAHDEFYLDEQAFRKMILELFYIKADS